MIRSSLGYILHIRNIVVWGLVRLCLMLASQQSGTKELCDWVPPVWYITIQPKVLCIVDLKLWGRRDMLVTGEVEETSTLCALEHNICIRPYMPTDFDRLATYDLKISAIPRASVLQLHLTSCVSAVVAFSDGKVVGYATTQQHSGFVHIHNLYTQTTTLSPQLWWSRFSAVSAWTTFIDMLPITYAPAILEAIWNIILEVYQFVDDEQAGRYPESGWRVFHL